MIIDHDLSLRLITPDLNSQLSSAPQLNFKKNSFFISWYFILVDIFEDLISFRISFFWVNFGHRAASMELEAIEVVEEHSEEKKMVQPILESTVTKSVNRARVRHVLSKVVDFAIDEGRANSMSKNGLSAEINAKGKTTFKYYQ